MATWEAGAAPPVEHRWAGLDRRKIGPTLAVLGVVVFWSGVVPAIDGATEADTPPQGSRIDLSNGVSFEPDADWTRAGVALPAAPSVRLYDGGTTFDIRAGEFDGTSEELLDRVTDVTRTLEVTGPVESLTVDGVAGASIRTVEQDTDGAVFAFASEGAGVEVLVHGHPNAAGRQVQDIAAMIASIQFGGEG